MAYNFILSRLNDVEDKLSKISAPAAPTAGDDSRVASLEQKNSELSEALQKITTELSRVEAASITHLNRLTTELSNTLKNFENYKKDVAQDKTVTNDIIKQFQTRLAALEQAAKSSPVAGQ